MVWEFVRIFSVFYDKLTDNNQWMDGVQVAVACLEGEEELSPEKIQLQCLFVGNSPASVGMTAHHFSYYHLGNNPENRAQISYLTYDDSAKPPELLPQFPFDLFLPGVNMSSLFLDKVNGYLNQSLQEKALGCKIEGISLRLNSTIYVSEFYKAELLFQNIGIVYRFALLIALDIRHQLKTSPLEGKEELYLVGYETYSIILVEQIKQSLADFPCHTLYYHRKRSDKKETYSKKARCIAIIPVATTLSTLYRMSEYYCNPDLCWDTYYHYALVLTRQSGQTDGIRQQDYWEDNGENLVSLCPRTKEEISKNLMCKYYLSPEAKWNRRESTEAVQEKVSISADSTSTIPSEIFMGEGSNYKGVQGFLTQPPVKFTKTEIENSVKSAKTASDKNTKRVEALKSKITYSHIKQGLSHYQFFIDMERYYETQESNIKEWLRGLEKPSQDGTVHVVFTPLRSAGIPFGKMVIDEVFSGAAHLVQVELESAYREDIRTTFSFISQEYQRSKEYNPRWHIKIYFVDTAITSGETIQRAKSLAVSLLEEAQVPYQVEDIFASCFLLVNRCSHEHIHATLGKEISGFHSYVHLAIPNFHMRDQGCPTCEMVSHYHRMENRTADHELGVEYRRLAEKQSVRDISTYRQWMETTVFQGEGYCSWIREWLYAYLPTSYEGEQWYGIFPSIKEEEFYELQGFFHLLGWGKSLCSHQEFTLDKLEKLLLTQKTKAMETPLLEECLKKLKNSSDRIFQRSFWLEVFWKYVYAQKSYLRLITSHTGFEDFPNTLVMHYLGTEKHSAATAQHLVAFINNRLGQDYIGPFHSEEARNKLEIEWLISYLKVLSRPQLARYHHIRQAIFSILLSLLQGAMDPDFQYTILELEKLGQYLKVEGNYPVMAQYQLLQAILKRLCGLQSVYLFSTENIRGILKYYQKLQEKYDTIPQESTDKNYRLYHDFPNEEKREKELKKLIQWASSSGDAEYGCFLIEDNFRKQEMDFYE